MIQSNQKTSLLVPYQLPKFISEDPSYANFILFLQAYYEWLEQEGNVLDSTKSIMSNLDVDTTSEQFLQYFLNDFMSYFPQEILSDQRKALKVAKQLYQSKGTPASYQFLFRLLYNTDVDFFYTKDAVLRASAGKWYVPKSLKLNTSDTNFLSIQNLRLFGDQSKSIATVEAAIFDGLKTEVFISNIERTFTSGETVTVVDSRNQPVYFLNGSIVPAGTINAETLSAVIVGQVSQVLINPNYRGSYYHIADPVVLYGGLNSQVTGPIGASAEVASVSSGSIQSIKVSNRGHGYTLSTPVTAAGQANTEIIFTNVTGTTPVAAVGSTDGSEIANVTYIPTDSITLKNLTTIGATNYHFANIALSNANTTLVNALSFTAFSTYPILSVITTSQGSGLDKAPTIEALSLYATEVPSVETNLANLGILAPIQIISGGSGYANNDQIALIGGSGFGAYANVTYANSGGTIINTAYVANSSVKVSLGGIGYNNSLPIAVVKRNATGTVTTTATSNVAKGTGTTFTTQFVAGAPLVTSNNIILGTVQSVVNANTLILTSNAYSAVTSNAVYQGTAILSVPATLGTGASFSAVPNRIGQIATFNMTNNGEDYVSAPNVSLKVQDLIVSNVSSLTIPTAGDIIYQGTDINSATYLAYVDSIIPLQNYYPETNSIYQLRVYNYTTVPKFGTALKITGKNSLSLVSNYNTVHNTTFDNSGGDTRFDSANGVMVYGDGQAKANATFLNGLVIGQGQYLDTTGQPSSFDVLQSEIYNNFTYQITLSKEIEKYRDILLNLVHPAGTRVLGRIAMKSNTSMNYTGIDALSNAHTLYAALGYNTGSAQITGGTFASPSNNIILMQTYGVSTNTLFTANVSTVQFNYGPGSTDYIKSLVTVVDGNYIQIQDNVWTYFANVAVGAAVAGNNRLINTTSFTGSYDIVNGGVYSNTSNPIIDVIRVGDTLSINGNSSVVTSVNTSTQRVTLQYALTNGANGLISISRTYNSQGNIYISGPLGTQYFPQLITDNGTVLLTEDGKTILLG